MAALPAIGTLVAAGMAVGPWGQILIYAGSTVLVNAMMDDMYNRSKDGPVGVELQNNVSDNTMSLPIIYGTVKLGGNDVYMRSSGVSNEYLWIVQVLGEGECEGFAQDDDSHDLVYVNDVLAYEYGSDVTYTLYTGTSTQTYDTNLNAVDSNWTDNMRRTTYIVWKIKYNAEKLTSVPKRTVVLKGRKVWLPDGTQAYSNNPAAILYDFLRAPHCGASLGYAGSNVLFTDEVDYYSYLAAYNHCATKGWEFNGVIMAGETVVDAIDKIRKHFRGSLRWSDGVFYMKYRDLNDETPVMSLTDDHIVRDENGKANMAISARSSFGTSNNYRVSFVNTTNYAYLEDYIMIGESDDPPKNIAFTGYQSSELAGAMGSYIAERNRDPYSRVLTGIFRDDAIQLERDDLIDLTCTCFKYTSQYMRVISGSWLPNGLIRLDLQLEHIDLYNDTYDVDIEGSYECTLPDVDAFDPINSAEKVTELSDADHVLTVADLNRVYILDSNSDRTITLPSVDSDQLGAWIKIIHYGTGKLTIQAADSDYIDESTAGGTIWHKEWT